MAQSDKLTHERGIEPGRATVALFRSKAEAREAIAELHKAHYTHTWLGVTSVAETNTGDAALTVEPATGSFFSGAKSLVEALVERGVHGDTAREIETVVEPGNAVLTLDPKDKELAPAVAMLERHGGRSEGSGLRGGERDAWLAPGRATDLDAATAGDWEEETFYRGTPVR